MNFSIEEVAVVVQGLIKVPPKTMEESWKGIDIIWSTWVGETISSSFPIIYNEWEVPIGTANLGLQVKSTMSGLRMANEMGYKYALKWRSDQLASNANAFMSLMDPRCINVLYWCTSSGGYYTDYFSFGKLELMMQLWDITDVSRYSYPEQALTEKMEPLPINCIGDYITKENDVTLYRSAGNLTCSDYKTLGNFIHRNKS